MLEQEEKYTITEVAKWLKSKGYMDATPGIIRYTEQQLSFEVERDNKLNRKYSIQDMERLQFVFSLKQEGLNYAGIKSILNRQAENVDSAVQVAKEEAHQDIVLQQENMQNLIEALTKQITASIKAELAVSVSTEIQPVRVEVKALQDKVLELTKENQKLQEEHFNSLDDKLRQIQEQTARKKGFLGLFGK